MNGSEALKVAQAALRFIAADERRKRARIAYHALLKQCKDDDTLVWGDGSRPIEPETLVEAFDEFRSAAASVAGYKRGLGKACQPSLLSGVPSKGLDWARRGRFYASP